jgi:hypothetical protein
VDSREWRIKKKYKKRGKGGVEDLRATLLEVANGIARGLDFLRKKRKRKRKRKKTLQPLFSNLLPVVSHAVLNF